MESLIENREDLDGTTKTYRRSYKSFDSEDTYNVEEEDTYTFHNNDGKIEIERNFKRHWDDGQEDNFHEMYNTARDILSYASIFRKSGK